MTNEELAELIQKTDSKTAKAELWENNKGILYRLARSYYRPNSPHTLEDLVQQGYFALLKAVKSYKREKGYKFTSYLHFSFQCAIRGLDMDTFISLDTPISEENETTIAETIPDNSTLEDIETALNLTAERQAIYNALERLEPLQRDIIISIYFHGETLTSIATRLSRSIEAIRQRHQRILKDLSKDTELMELYADVIQDKQLKSLHKTAERPDRVESRHAIEVIERKQKRKEREIDFLNTLRAFIEGIPEDNPDRLKYMEYLEREEKALRVLECI